MTRRRISTVDQSRFVLRDISKILDTGRAALVDIRVFEMPKTYEQLKKLHAIIGDFAASQDRSARDMKFLLKDYLGYFYQVARKNGKPITVYKSFADANRKELSEFIDRLIVLADEYGVDIDE